MKAAVLREIGKPIEIAEVPTPTAGPGEVLIKVNACGVCHSDLHLADGDWDLLRPITKLIRNSTRKTTNRTQAI